MFNLKSYIDDIIKNLNDEDRKKANEEGIVNYLPDSDLEKIIKDKSLFNDFIWQQKLNRHFIDMAIRLCPDRATDFGTIIKNYASLFTIEDFKTLFKNNNISNLWRGVLYEMSDKLPDDVFLYLCKEHYINIVKPEKLGVYLRDKLKDKKIEDMYLGEAVIAALYKKLTLDEIEIILKKLLSEKDVSILKSALGLFTKKPNLPPYVVETLIKNWDYNEIDGDWFLELLRNQNLDTVTDYLIGKYKFDDYQIVLIKANKMTSIESIQKLCKNRL